MGYESRFYIANKLGAVEEDGMRWAEIIGMYNMCKYYPLSMTIKQYKDTDCYFYLGDEKVVEDKYGDALKEIEVDELVDALKEEVANGETYRRIFPLLSMLEAIKDQQKQGQWEDVVVLHYGY